MRFLLLVILSFAFTFNLYSQSESYTLRGKVVDKDTGKPLVGVTVICNEIDGKGAISDANGLFGMLLPNGKYRLTLSYVGYGDVEKNVTVNKNRRVEWNMKRKELDIADVIIDSNPAADKIASTQIGAEKIAINTMSKLPALLGERDIIRTLTLLPGVKQESDGSSGFEVRGGNPSQNMIQLNDAPIYNSGHVMGIFSIFNDDILQDATLYKGLIPAEFGGGTASVLDITTKRGQNKGHSFGVDIGLLFSKAYAEGAIVEDKLSFIAAGRRSYFDMFFKLTDEYSSNVVNFYDINGVINYNANKNNVFTLSLFNGRDNLGLEDVMSMGWGNSAATLRWFHSYSDRLKSTTSAVWSQFDTNNKADLGFMDMEFKGHINNQSVKHNFIYTSKDENYVLKSGVQATYIDLTSTDYIRDGINYLERRYGLESSAWLSGELKIGDMLTILAGIRANLFTSLGGSPYYTLTEDGDIETTTYYDKYEVVNNHFNWEPRFSFNYLLSSELSIKGGYSRTVQNIHAMRSVTSSSPFDRYIISSNIIKPQVANQVSIGTVIQSYDDKYELTIEGYYKEMDNVYDYREGKDFNAAVEVESIISGGEGRSYGLEVMAQKKIGRITGWIGYTLSWTMNRIEGISGGEWYTASNDRRHDISIVAMYDLSPKWSLSATWVYNTGQALTAPSAKYEIGGETYFYYAERNGYRAPANHRLDVGLTNSKDKGKYIREWRFGIYNLYNRYNPYMIMFNTDDANPTGIVAKQYSLFGILPSISYSIRF